MTSRVLFVLRALDAGNLLSLVYKSGSSGVTWQAGSCTLLSNFLYRLVNSPGNCTTLIRAMSRTFQETWAPYTSNVPRQQPGGE